MQQSCVRSSSNRDDILQIYPMLKYENDKCCNKTSSINIIDILFTCVVIFLVTVETLYIGCGLEMEQLIKNFKRSLPLIIGFICQ